jgi:hypothetical protein
MEKQYDTFKIFHFIQTIFIVFIHSDLRLISAIFMIVVIRTFLLVDYLCMVLYSIFS